MKIIVSHASPDWDAIASVWVIKRFLPGWQHATVEFVPPGDKSERVRNNKDFVSDVIVTTGQEEIIHVDTGGGPLDHHQVYDTETSSALKSWEFIRQHLLDSGEQFTANHDESITRMMKVIVGYDHFKEIFLPDPANDYYDFSLGGLLDGMKLERQQSDMVYIDFGTTCLDAMFQRMENKVWTEKEFAEKGIVFETKFGKGIALETVSHAALKFGQRMGYVIVIRKDPRNGYLAITSRPPTEPADMIDLTLVHEQYKKMDPDATWYFHISKQILLNGNMKSSTMKPTRLTLDEIINVVKNTYK